MLQRVGWGMGWGLREGLFAYVSASATPPAAPWTAPASGVASSLLLLDDGPWTNGPMDHGPSASCIIQQNSE